MVESVRGENVGSLSEEKCPVCGSSGIDTSIDIHDVPIYCNVLWPSREEAVNAPKGDISVGYCHDCGHVFNKSFDPSLMSYTEDYENSLHYSPTFNEYAESLASRLLKKYQLKNKSIIEIGCGKGDFLSMLCARGENRGYGFDKSFEADRVRSDTHEHVTFIQDFYGEKYADYDADLVVCRHVLEHIQYPQVFLQNIRRVLGEQTDTVVYFEVPNALYTLKDMGIWDLIYEHCGYFSVSSLTQVFELAGFEICEVGESFGGQFLYVEAKPRTTENAAEKVFQTSRKSMLDELAVYVAAFEENYRAKVDGWREKLASLESDNKRAVIWGGGSKGITFLNVLKAEQVIDYVVDMNPHKHGLFAPGTGQEVIAPETLKELRPDHVIVMNGIYQDEISSMLVELGIAAEVSCV